jgi:alpha-beta hydrolase superfamily lysophospholipase
MMNLLDHPQILRVLFHPRREGMRLLHSLDVRPVAVQVEPGLNVGGRLYPADPDDPAILYYHGNGEIAADYDDIALLYTRMGITLLVMDYRGYGRSDGAPTAHNLLADAVTVFDAVGRVFEDNDLTPAQLYVMGRSLGSAAAIETALHAREQLAGLIVESGFADTFALLARLGVGVQDADEERDGFGNPAKMARITTRTLVIHGQADVLIPASNGQELYRRCAAPDKQLLLIPGGGHNDLMMVGMAEYFEAIRMFVCNQEPHIGKRVLPQ